MSTGMYCNIHLLEIMRVQPSSPLYPIHPLSQGRFYDFNDCLHAPGPKSRVNLRVVYSGVFIDKIIFRLHIYTPGMNIP